MSGSWPGEFERSFFMRNHSITPPPPHLLATRFHSNVVQWDHILERSLHHWLSIAARWNEEIFLTDARSRFRIFFIFPAVRAFDEDRRVTIRAMNESRFAHCFEELGTATCLDSFAKSFFHSFHLSANQQYGTMKKNIKTPVGGLLLEFHRPPPSPQ